VFNSATARLAFTVIAARCHHSAVLQSRKRKSRSAIRTIAGGVWGQGGRLPKKLSPFWEGRVSSRCRPVAYREVAGEPTVPPLLLERKLQNEEGRKTCVESAGHHSQKGGKKPPANNNGGSALGGDGGQLGSSLKLDASTGAKVSQPVRQRKTTLKLQKCRVHRAG